jgi:hypothetical protein
MRCHRCENMLFPVDLLDEGGGVLSQTAAWRCFACGDITDPLINRNRNLRRHTEQYKRGPRLQSPFRFKLVLTAAGDEAESTR